VEPVAKEGAAVMRRRVAAAGLVLVGGGGSADRAGGRALRTGMHRWEGERRGRALLCLAMFLREHEGQLAFLL